MNKPQDHQPTILVRFESGIYKVFTVKWEYVEKCNKGHRYPYHIQNETLEFIAPTKYVAKKRIRKFLDEPGNGDIKQPKWVGEE